MNKKLAQMQKLTKLLENLTDPQKLLKALLPLNASLFVDFLQNVTIQGVTWDNVLLIKELETEEETATAKGFKDTGYTLLDLLTAIPLGVIEIKGEIIPQWNGLNEVIMLKLRRVV